ncbi:AAA family ATPase [Kribbella sp. NBC_00662]|uniref:AAA family ATPase n=1 Tax=Kribbella sp. NBC_00662 TaxID=2975969 RepID=UPI003250555E
MTMLVGANNAGKTSLYSPLLLLKQTVESAHRATPLLSQGRLFDAGRFSDFVRNHDIEQRVTFSIDLTDLISEIASDNANVTNLPAEFMPSVFELSFTAGDEAGLRTALRRYRLTNRENQTLFRRTLMSSGSYAMGGTVVPGEKQLGPTPEPFKGAISAVRSETPENFFFGGFPLLFAVDFQDLGNKQRAAASRWMSASVRTFQVQQTANMAIRNALRQVSYVGPLRAMPKRTYRISPEAPQDVGVEGEFAPEILYRNKVDGDGELVHQVGEFLEDCGYGRIDFQERGDGDAFSVVVGGRAGANLVDCGMGLSQILPLVTQVLGAGSSSLAIVQQPEIHLNPALQVKLLELLAGSVKRGRRVLIETHSEHLLLRLRRLIAQGEISTDIVTLMFAERTEGRSTLREIGVSDVGAISRDDWPRGFFAEQLDDSILLARQQARRAREERGADGGQA